MMMTMMIAMIHENDDDDCLCMVMIMEAYDV